MKLANCIIVFVFGLQSVSFAQAKNKLRFSNIEQVAFITANKPNSINLETINGVKYGTWSAGIGLGIDWQKARSIPLFLDARKYFGLKKNSWFIYADVGKNVWWEKNTNGDFFTTVTPYKSTYFTEAGIGYLFQLYKKTIFISGGYGYKNIQYSANYTNYLSGFYPADYYSYQMNTYINRLVFKIGIQF